MKTSKDIFDFCFEVYDWPLELEKTRQKYIQAHKCSNDFLQTGLASDNKIKEAQNKIDRILYIEDNKKNIPESYWIFQKVRSELIDIVTDLNGYMTIRNR